jgi:hypothetical protein
MWFPRSKVFTHPAFHAGKGSDGRRPSWATDEKRQEFHYAQDTGPAAC